MLARIWKSALTGDLAVLGTVGAIGVLLHTLTNGQYGFHRDELGTLDNARHLAWGYVEYPPLTPFMGRVELGLFGISLRGFRFSLRWRKASCWSSPVSQPANSAANARRNLWLPWR